MTPEIYISITQGDHRLIIDGSFDLLKNFMTTFTQDGGTLAAPMSTVYNPAPQTGDIHTQGAHHD